MKYPLFLLFIFIISIVQAQESYSLQQAQDFALKNNINNKNAQIDVEIAKKKVWETTAAGLPQVSLNSDYQNFLELPTTVLPANAFNPLAPEGELIGLQFGTDYNLTGALQVSQLIFNGNYIVGLQASKAYKNISTKMADKTEQDTKVAITEAYYTVLMLQKNEKVLDSTITALKTIHNYTKILVEEKVIESIGAEQIELSVFQVKNGLSKIKAQVAVAKNLLKLQMGLELAKTITLTDKLDAFIGDSGEAFTLSNFNTKENLDYKLLKNKLTTDELLLKNSRASFLPSLSAFYSYQQSGYRNTFNFTETGKEWYPTQVWGLNLSIPVFSSGSKISQTKQAQLEVSKTLNSIQQLDQAIQLQIVQAIANFNSAKDIYQMQQRAVEISKKILRNTQIKHKEGVASSMELTQAQNQYLNAQTELTNAIFNLLNAKITINKLRNKL